MYHQHTCARFWGKTVCEAEEPLLHVHCVMLFMGRQGQIFVHPRWNQGETEVQISPKSDLGNR